MHVYVHVCVVFVLLWLLLLLVYIIYSTVFGFCGLAGFSNVAFNFSFQATIATALTGSCHAYACVCACVSVCLCVCYGLFASVWLLCAPWNS